MRTREPSADSATLIDMRLSWRAPPPPVVARPEAGVRTDATCCADALSHADAAEIKSARANSATAGETFFIMGLGVRRHQKSGDVPCAGFIFVSLDLHHTRRRGGECRQSLLCSALLDVVRAPNVSMNPGVFF